MGTTAARTIFFWRDTEFFLEDPVKVRDVIEAGFKGDAGDRKLRPRQLSGSHFQTVLVQVFNTCHIHMTLEKAHEVVFTEMTEFCQFLYGHGILVMLLDKL